jgi:hypothetical protein
LSRALVVVFLENRNLPMSLAATGVDWRYKQGYKELFPL